MGGADGLEQPDDALGRAREAAVAVCRVPTTRRSRAASTAAVPPPRSSGPPTSRRTPSCTATATSASSTAPARPPSWSRRPCGSGCTRSPSPTTTASTARPLLAEAAAEHGLPTVYGAELSLGLGGPQNGVPDPEGSHLLVLARGVEGYHRLAAAMTDAHLRGDEKGRPVYDLDELAERGRGHWVVLTGCRKGPVRRALAAGGPAAAAEALDRLTALFGLDHVVVELSPHPGADDGPTTVLAGLAGVHGLSVVAAGNVHHATPRAHRLASAMAAVRARRSLAEIDGWLDLSALAHLRSGDEMARALARLPRRRRRAASRSPTSWPSTCARPRRGCRSDRIPDGAHRRLVAARAGRARASRSATPATPHDARGARAHRARAARHRGEGLRRLLRHRPRHRRVRPRAATILCQGRGSAASSAVCYALGITAVDAVLLPAAVRAVHLRAPRRGARHRRRLRLRPARGGDPVGLRHLRPAQRRPGRQRHRLPAADGGPRRRQGARPLPGPAGRLVQADRRLAAVVTGDMGDPAAHDVPVRSWRSPTSSSARRGTSASTPAAWCSPSGRSARSARSSGRGWTGAPCCSGTRTPARRWGWSSSTCSGSACSARSTT